MNLIPELGDTPPRFACLPRLGLFLLLVIREINIAHNIILFVTSVVKPVDAFCPPPSYQQNNNTIVGWPLYYDLRERPRISEPCCMNEYRILSSFCIRYLYEWISTRYLSRVLEAQTTLWLENPLYPQWNSFRFIPTQVTKSTANTVQ